MAKMSVKEFEDINVFSNKNVENVLKDIINESSNAALVNVFDDYLVLLDHEEGQIYFAKYELDPNELTVTINEFEEVELYKEENDLNEIAMEYFEDESSLSDLASAFKNTYIEQDSYVKEMTQEALINKDTTEAINWNEMKIINQDNNYSFKKDPIYKEYKERLETHPLTEIKYFDWENPIKVSLVETEDVNVINTSAVEAATDLWKDEDFKEDFTKNCNTMVEDVEEGFEDMANLIREYPQILLMEAGERQSMFGKAIIYNDELKEHSEDLLKGMSELFERTDFTDVEDEYLFEADDEMKSTSSDDTPKEVPKKSMKKLCDDLKSISTDAQDPALKRRLDKVIKGLEGYKTGTNVEAVKEAVSILEI